MLVTVLPFGEDHHGVGVARALTPGMIAAKGEDHEHVSQAVRTWAPCGGCGLHRRAANDHDNQEGTS
jgi:hypothetical protein